MDPERPTLIDAHGDVEGNLKGKDAQIFGRFRGEIELSGRLALGDGARVQAKVVADAAEIGGEFRGELKVRSLVLLEKGRFEGILEAQTITVREGAQLNGSVNTGPTRTGGGMMAPHPHPPSGVLAG
jgi:cytoskeletal protein CcmA (bactofilin family)